MQNRSLLGLILAATALPGCGEPLTGRACVDVPEDAATCPAAGDVDPADLYVPADCDGLRVVGISGTGTLTDVSYATYDSGAAEDLACCYAADLLDPNPNQDCVIGRPWTEGGAVRLAEVHTRSGAAADGLRARAWARAGAGEHASIAAFARLGLELMAHGAPTALLREVFAAGKDEVDHADACFALAARFGGEDVRPGRFPFGGDVAVHRDLATVAAEAAREGCVGETLGAVLARTCAERADLAEVRAAFAAIAADESRHAVLSWRIVAWALAVGGPEVRAAVDAAFRAPAPTPDLAGLAVRAGVPAAALSAAYVAGLKEVVRPAAGAVLAA